jgi:hypothetical protein
MHHILIFEFVQNSNDARSGFTLIKRSGMVSNLLKRWRDDFALLKGRGMVLGLFEKKRDAIPPHPAPPQTLFHPF